MTGDYEQPLRQTCFALYWVLTEEGQGVHINEPRLQGWRWGTAGTPFQTFSCLPNPIPRQRGVEDIQAPREG
jgi:hypothetical protein